MDRKRPLGVIIFLMAVSFLHCQSRHRFDVHIGRAFYSLALPSYVRTLGSDVLRDRDGENCRITGVYTRPDGDLIEYPLIRFYEHEAGLKYARLASEIDHTDGDLIVVEGHILQRDIPSARARTVLTVPVLEPDTVQVIDHSSEMKSLVQREYVTVRQALQDRITPAGSRLLLPETPRWYIVWSEHDDSFIVSARAGDLMYQAEIDYVLDGRTGRIRDVYAVEWFKGE